MHIKGTNPRAVIRTFDGILSRGRGLHRYRKQIPLEQALSGGNVGKPSPATLHLFLDKQKIAVCRVHSANTQFIHTPTQKSKTKA